MTIRVGERPVEVELALDPERRARGLMYRQVLAEDSGMLFIETRERIMDFWMKNTVIPLSIAYIRADGVITDIHEMAVEAPGTADELHNRYHSSEPVRYALEMNQGWFRRHGVKPGDSVRFSDRVRAAMGQAR